MTVLLLWWISIEGCLLGLLLWGISSRLDRIDIKLNALTDVLLDKVGKP
jgi:hypothetical protein